MKTLALLICIVVTASLAQIGPVKVFRVVESDSLRTGKLIDSTNVVMFGAKGNGVHDDALSIQHAIDAVSVTGGMVTLPVGVFSVSVPIQLKSNVKLKGSGYGGTVLRKTAPADGAVVKAVGVSNFEISGMSIINYATTAAGAGNAVDIYNGSHDGQVVNCLIDSSWNGIVVSGLESVSGSNIGIFNNIIRNMGENGVGANIRGTNGIQISDNHIYNYGIHATGIVGAGIEYRGGSGAVIADNIIENAPYYPEEEANDGIRMENVTEDPAVPSRASVISGNVIRNISGHGLRLQLPTDCVITGNRIDSVRYGITLLSSSYGQSENNNITGNVISNATSHAIYVVGTTGAEIINTLFEGNIISRSQAAQVYIAHGNALVFQDNMIVDGRQQGIYDTDSKNNIFDGNTFINNGSLYTHVALNLINSDSAIISGGKIYQGRITTSAGILIDSNSTGVKLYPMTVVGSTTAYLNNNATTAIPTPAQLNQANTFTTYSNRFAHGVAFSDSVTLGAVIQYVAGNTTAGTDNHILILSPASDAGSSRGASMVLRGNQYPDADSGKAKVYAKGGYELYTGASGITATFDYLHNLTLSGSYNGLTLTKNSTGFSIAGGVTAKTLTVNNSMTLQGTDASTLDIGTGGTLASTAFTPLSGLAQLAGYNRFAHAITLADTLIMQNTTSYMLTNTVDGADNKLVGFSSGGGTGVARGAGFVLRGNEYPDGDAGKFKAYAGTQFEFYSGASGISLTLDASHNATVAGSVTSTGYKLSALQMAPSTSSSTGTVGEIRFASGYLYLCTATNTWVRAALTTW